MSDFFADMLNELDAEQAEASLADSQTSNGDVICVGDEEESEPSGSLPSSSSPSVPNKTSCSLQVTPRVRPAARRSLQSLRRDGLSSLKVPLPPFERTSSEKLAPLLVDPNTHDLPCVLAIPQSAKRKRTIKKKVEAPLPVPLWPQYSLTWKGEPIKDQKWITVAAKEYWLVRLCDSMTNMSYKEVVKKVVDKFSVGLSDPSLVRHALSGRGGIRSSERGGQVGMGSRIGVGLR